MRSWISIFLIVLGSLSLPGQSLNLDFEQVQSGLPSNWNPYTNGGYTHGLDSLEPFSGSYSARISSNDEGGDFATFTSSFPANYSGERIRLTGYIRTENVSGGRAGLWMRIDPGVGFDNMQDRGPMGTTDWTRYEIELSLKPEQAQSIVFGAMLVGKGTMWVDSLQITIDGLPLEEAKSKELYPAEKDSTFVQGSGIQTPDLTTDLVEDLALLGKVWGFMKYHHPAIAKGLYNWDNELFRFLDPFLVETDGRKRMQQLINWVDSYNSVPPCDPCMTYDEDAFLKPDHSWINPGMDPELRKRLEFIRTNRHSGAHYYVSMAPYVGNPQFQHEMTMDDPYPDAGYRLLSLFRFWNMIHYFFPNRHLIDRNWHEVMLTYIPRFLEAENELDYELAAIQLIGEIQDTHANLWGGGNAIDEAKGAYYPPVHLRFIENGFVVTDFYNPEMRDEVGLELGDKIISINGREVDDLVDSIRPYYPASNEAAQMRDIGEDLLRASTEWITVQVARLEKQLELDLKLYPRSRLNIYHWYRRDEEPSFKVLEDNIGYITLKTIRANDIPVIKDSLRDTQGIIIDIRNYPSTFVPFLLGSWFMPDSTAFVKFTHGSINNPGQFVRSPPLQIPPDYHPYTGKLVVLVNELSQSQSEYTAMAFRAGPHTTVIGSMTAGADGNVSTILLPGRLRTMISGIGIHYPDGTETQRVGIVPDVWVTPSIAGIRAGRDEVLERAIRLILGE